MQQQNPFLSGIFYYISLLIREIEPDLHFVLPENNINFHRNGNSPLSVWSFCFVLCLVFLIDFPLTTEKTLMDLAKRNHDITME